MLRYKLIAALLALLASGSVTAQELFVFSEPASNMPAKSVGIRVSNWIMQEQLTSGINYHLIPEVMWGVNKNLMLHAEAFVSNRNTALALEGVGVYGKYRFYSKDDVYRHFRMAAFGRAAINNADIHQETINTNGHNTGWQLGLIGTQLLHKLALSSTAYYEQALDNSGGNELPVGWPSNAVNYSVSAGRLLLPRHYTSYKQVNMNFMVELLGQILPERGRQFIDVAPSVQFIFNSQTRVDIGYRRQLYSDMQRTAPNGVVLRVEHLLFNVL